MAIAPAASRPHFVLAGASPRTGRHRPQRPQGRSRTPPQPPRSWSTSSCATAAAGRSPISPRRISRSPRTASPEDRQLHPRVARRRHRRRRRLALAATTVGQRRRPAPRRPPPTPATEDATTAIVFDHLSAETLRLAQRATLDYVPVSGESSVRVGVFATDLGIRAVQRYTTDRAADPPRGEQRDAVGTSDEERRRNAPTN